MNGALLMQNAVPRLRKAVNPLFAATVILPTVAASLYFGAFASDVYISESKFVVRSPDKPQSSGFGFLLKNVGFSSAGEEVFAAQNYIQSRDALAAVNQNNRFLNAYTRPDISIFDRFAPLGIDDSFEDLFEYFSDRIVVDYDTTTSITTLKVRAFTPADAQHFNRALLEMAERTVNAMNTRGRQDLIGFATTEVEIAKRRSAEAAAALASYRNQAGVVDPEKQASLQLQMIAKLQDELIAARTQLAQLQQFAPSNPQVSSLEVRIKSLSGQIDNELGKVAGDRKSLAASAAQYQRLFVETQFAEKQLAAAMASLETAQNEARRKQAYVERIVEPNKPDAPLEPRRLRGVLVTLVMGLITWGILTMLLAGIREHKD